MKALVLDAKWEPRPDYALSEWEKQTGKAITGSSVWRHPKLEVRTVPDPKPGPTTFCCASRPAASAARIFTFTSTIRTIISCTPA